MAKKNSKGQEGNKISMVANAKLGDIYTASKAAMDAVSYEKGYPSQPGVLRQLTYKLEKGGK